MENSKTGAFIRKIRKEKNMTQKELAERLHITDRAVSKWERGLSAPDISLLEPLAEILEVPVADVIAGEAKESVENFVPDTNNDSVENTQIDLEYNKEAASGNKLKYFGSYLLIIFASICFAEMFSEWFRTGFERNIERGIGILLFSCIAMGCAGLIFRQKKRGAGRYSIQPKILIIAIAQWTVLMASWYLLFGYSLVVPGAIVIYLQMIFSFLFTGWISSAAYSLTYWISRALDKPGEGNWLFYWTYSYLAVIITALLVEFIWQKRRRK